MPPRSEIEILQDMVNYIKHIDLREMGFKEITVDYFCTNVLNLVGVKPIIILDHGDHRPPTIADLLNKIKNNEKDDYGVKYGDGFIAVYNEMKIKKVAEEKGAQYPEDGAAVAARVVEYLESKIEHPPMNLDGGRRKFRKSRKTNRKYKANKTNRRNRNRNRTYRKRHSRRR
jgi:hypothetical protein